MVHGSGGHDHGTIVLENTFGLSVEYLFENIFNDGLSSKLHVNRRISNLQKNDWEELMENGKPLKRRVVECTLNVDALKGYKTCRAVEQTVISNILQGIACQSESFLILFFKENLAK